MDCEQSADREVEALRTLLAHRVDGLLVSTVGLDREQFDAIVRRTRPVRLLRQLDRRSRRGRVILDNDARDRTARRPPRRARAPPDRRSSPDRRRRRAASSATAALRGRDGAPRTRRFTIAGIAGSRWSSEEGAAGDARAARAARRRRRRSSPRASSSRSGRCSPAASAASRIPDDLALVTFDDAYFAELLDPPLTAVAYDPRRGGGRPRPRCSSRRSAPSAGRRATSRSPVRLVARRLVRVRVMTDTPAAIRLVGVSKRYGGAGRAAARPTSRSPRASSSACSARRGAARRRR